MKVTRVETRCVTVKVLGALANTIYLEYMPWFSKLYNETIKFAEGPAIVPERPGWGFTFNQDYVSHLARA
jgi:L-alanine-DL-glutamate epimerase-like enolase superfamily enzyme